MEYRLLSGARCHGKRYAMAGILAAHLLIGETVLSITIDPAGTRKAIEDRLKLWGDTEPDTALCGLTCQP